ASGYQPEVHQVDITQGETTNLDVSLANSEDIALIASGANQDRLTGFLEEQGYNITSFDRDELDVVKENIGDFALILMNDSVLRIDQDEYVAFIDAADEARVSMLFGSQYGGGAINDLRDYLNDPDATGQGFAADQISYEVVEEHPIFKGYEVGDVISILDNEGGNQQYHVFENYSGTTIADVVHDDEGQIENGLAYDLRSSDHVHLLLGSLGASTYGYPVVKWTDDAKTIYVSAVDWALSASLGEIKGVVETDDGRHIENATVSIESENKKVQTNDQGRYTLGVGSGEYEVSVRALGYKGAEETV